MVLLSQPAVRTPLPYMHPPPHMQRLLLHLFLWGLALNPHVAEILMWKWQEKRTPSFGGSGISAYCLPARSVDMGDGDRSSGLICQRLAFVPSPDSFFSPVPGFCTPHSRCVGRKAELLPQPSGFLSLLPPASSSILSCLLLS